MTADPPPPTTPSPTDSALRRAGAPRSAALRSAALRPLRRLAALLPAFRPASVSENESFLPLLVRVLAGFARLGGEALEAEINSTLGFLRYDYPEAIYSELQARFLDALRHQQDLSDIADKLARQLSPERKFMLGVQLYDLIARAGLQQSQVMAYYSFMSQLDMSSQAFAIANQLNPAPDTSAPADLARSADGPFESLSFGRSPTADVFLPGLRETERLLAFRYHDLVLLKNLCSQSLIVRGRTLPHDQFRRIFPGERIVMDETVISYPDLISYFNAKKNVAVPRIYITVRDGREVRLEKSASRDSAFGITFGLRVTVQTLRNVGATLNGVALKKGVSLQATLEDRILFASGGELLLRELRGRAREMGARFELRSGKREYLVSNNPSLLRPGDILLSPSANGDILLRILCDYENRTGRLEVLKSPRPVMLGQTAVRHAAMLVDGDLVRLNNVQTLRCNFAERIIEEERNIVRRLEVRDLSHHFRRGARTALDSVAFTVQRGEMVCVMGPSGSGKSTLMRVIAGHLRPDHGEIRLNGQNLYQPQHTDDLAPAIAYVPHEDSFDENLTIRENLAFSAALRAPHLRPAERQRRVDSKLVELGLNDRKNTIVGPERQKNLSGGERKRVNLGLDMIGSADIYLFDEPTSGLSSKDSEHVIDILASLSTNKIVLVTIHQPSLKLFNLFDKAILLDKGGRLVFFGTPAEMLDYFSQNESAQELGLDFPRQGRPMQPEDIFEVLETPLRDLSGDMIYEEDPQGQRIPTRRFSPEYWRDKFVAYRLIREVEQISLDPEDTPAAPADPSLAVPPAPTRRHVLHRWRDEASQFLTLLHRAFLSKLRNRSNLLTTLVEAPALALLIATVLRYSEQSRYDFASAFHIPVYIFLSLIVAMFLGLTNSADDILRERVQMERERNLQLRLSSFLAAKVLTLLTFGLIQCLLFVLIGNFILEIRGMFGLYLLQMTLTSLSGIALGLLVSALVPDAKTAANLVPLILVPQIILGGALIKYEEMNTKFDLIYAFERWAVENHRQGDPEPEKGQGSRMRVPPLCEMIPMRWSYEALVVAQAKLNPLTLRQDRIQKAMKDLVALPSLTPAQAERLDVLKETLAFVHGLQGQNIPHLYRQLHRADLAAESGSEQDLKLLSTPDDATVSGEELFQNRKVADLVSKAEIEQADYQAQPPVNVFFSPVKTYFGAKFSVLTINTIVLNALTFLVLFAVHLILRHQLRRR